MTYTKRLLEVVRQLESEEEGTHVIMMSMVWLCLDTRSGTRRWYRPEFGSWDNRKLAEYLVVWEDRYAWCMY